MRSFVPYATRDAVKAAVIEWESTGVGCDLKQQLPLASGIAVDNLRHSRSRSHAWSTLLPTDWRGLQAWSDDCDALLYLSNIPSSLLHQCG